MTFIYNDGGRAAAGFKGTTGDCACRAVAIATGRPYREIYDALNEIGSRERTGRRKRGTSDARTGVYKGAMHKYMDSIGWRWKPTMSIGSGCKTHVRADELPSGRLVLNLSKHYAAFIDGHLHDNHDSSRDGTRCVYGFWSEE